MKDHPLVQIMKLKADKNPYIISFICRLLLISSGFNDYLVLIIGVNFK